jgi:endonuclease-8
MNQSVMAGVGNIYRTEILWRQAIHPLTPGREISRNIFEKLWSDAKFLLELGVKYNAIITTDSAEPSKSKYRERVNIFAKDKCPKCNSKIEQFTIASRRAFACETCQSLAPNDPKEI